MSGCVLEQRFLTLRGDAVTALNPNILCKSKITDLRKSTTAELRYNEDQGFSLVGGLLLLDWLRFI